MLLPLAGRDQVFETRTFRIYRESNFLFNDECASIRLVYVEVAILVFHRSGHGCCVAANT
jgi:hypothetical protein